MRGLTHLQRLEAESIHIFREVVATCENPVLMYSIGKDSAVLLHLAIKSFYPAPLPFPLLHVDTTWKFREMITFRDRRVAELGCKLIVHINEDGLKAGVNPFTSGSRLHRTEPRPARDVSESSARRHNVLVSGSVPLAPATLIPKPVHYVSFQDDCRVCSGTGLCNWRVRGFSPWNRAPLESCPDTMLCPLLHG